MPECNNKFGQCVYCGTVGKITKDHIPPKNLFSKPRPSNLITVEACHQCHSNTSEDDEHFRLVLHAREDVAEHPAAKRLRPSVMRSLDRPEAIGMVHGFAQSITPIELKTPSGIFIKHHFGFYANMDRMNRVASRIVKGLFYHEKKHRLPDNYEVRSQSEDSVRQRPPSEREFLEQNFIKPVLPQKRVKIGDGVFAYRFNTFADEPNSTVWILEFYERACFLALTSPPESKTDENSPAL